MVDEDAPLADIEAEAARLLDRAAEAKVLVRLLGGAAVGMHRHGPRPAVLDRRYGDIDVVVKKGQDRGLKRLLGELGYVPTGASTSCMATAVSSSMTSATRDRSTSSLGPSACDIRSSWTIALRCIHRRSRRPTCC